MRKHKSVVAILLAVMMIFTFMPTMASAYAGQQTWNDGYASGTIDSDGTGAVTYNATRTWNDDGVITAQMKTPGAAGAEAKPVGTPKHFIDLNNAFVGYTDGKKYDKWTYNALAEGYNETTGEVRSANYNLMLVQPEYTFAKDQKEAAKVKLSETNATYDDKYVVGTHNSKCFTVTVTAEGFTPGVYEEQTVVLHTTVTGGNSTYADMLYGAVPDQTIKVSGKTPAASDMKVYVDGDKTKADALASENVSLTYDGETHKLVAATVPGFEVKYTVQNEKTKVYEEKDSVEFRNVGTTTVKISVINSKTGAPVGSVHKCTITVNQDSSKTPTFGFKAVAEREKYEYELTAEQAADPAKFVELKSGTYFKSDAEELMSAFNDVYEVKVEKTASNENLQTWTLAPKYDFDAAPTSADGKAIAELSKKYETLLNNYGSFTTDEDADRVVVKVDTAAELNTKDDDITFTGVTTKAFKAKKKTKKLAKTKSFQIAAAADSGNAVTFKATTSNAKIKVSATGKVTVKKGLKKGTYKVVVKAKTAAGNGYKACKETKTYTIKIK